MRWVFETTCGMKQRKEAWRFGIDSGRLPKWLSVMPLLQKKLCPSKKFIWEVLGSCYAWACKNNLTSHWWRCFSNSIHFSFSHSAIQNSLHTCRHISVLLLVAFRCFMWLFDDSVLSLLSLFHRYSPNSGVFFSQCAENVFLQMLSPSSIQAWNAFAKGRFRARLFCFPHICHGSSVVEHSLMRPGCQSNGPLHSKVKFS